MTKAKGASRLSKGHKKDAKDLLVESAKVIDKLKAFLVRRPAHMTLQQTKDMTIHASTVTKNLKDHKKDLDLPNSKALSSGEGLAKKEGMQDPCQKGSWSLGKRFPVGCLGLCAQKGCAPLSKRCLTRPCPKGQVVFRSLAKRASINNSLTKGLLDDI